MSIQESIRYGAAELKRFYNRNLGLALAISVGFHLVLIFLYIFGTNLGKASDKTSAAPIAKMKLTNLAPPPPEENVPPPPPPPMVPPQLQMSGSGTGGVAARAGNPVPVPDALIAPDVKEFATTAEISVATAVGGDGTGFGGLEGEGLGAPVPINEPVQVKEKETIPEPDEFVAYEKEPDFDLADVNRRAKYPEMARKNGIEGRVTVQVYIDKQGKPQRPRVVQSDNKILEASAIEAVMGTRFSPAIQNNNPVGVWISIPVTYRLN